MPMTLTQLRSELCSSGEHHCRRCFVTSPTTVVQCPPNVFRTEGQKPIAFIFDKPNDNTRYRKSSLVPITVFDDRAGVDSRLSIAPSHVNLITLCQMLEGISPGAHNLSSPLVHITNAVKCDVSCETGKTGRIVLPANQVETCTENFLANELRIVNPKALVFFGINAQRYVLNEQTPLWDLATRPFGGREYVFMRVPHTSPESFNTHGDMGRTYIEPFKRLQKAIA